MYEIFEKLCNERNVTPYRVSKETNISRSTLTDWKQGTSTPKQDKLKKIADYFNVSMDYLMTGKEFDVYSDDNAHMVSQIRSDIELSKVLPKYFELPENKKKHIIELINLLSE